MRFDVFKYQVRGKDIAVIGVGISNVPVIKALIDSGARVFAFDRKKNIGQLSFDGSAVRWYLGEDYLSKLSSRKFDIIFKTPSIRPDIPELLEAKRLGAKITSEIDLFCECCPAPIIAVTGSDGKTTTSTLVYEMLKQEGYKCYLGGNIGCSLIDKVDSLLPSDRVVLELSSFQLQSMTCCPQIAVLTNITPNHLDWHSSMEEYVLAKRNIFIHQCSGKFVTNYDNIITRKISERTEDCTFFSREHLLDDGICLENNFIVECKNSQTIRKFLDLRHIKIRNSHNIENYMAAIGAVCDQVSDESIEYIARNFNGVEHRIEFVRELNGVRFYNDSVATTPARSGAALKSFKQKIILIAGGYDKKISFTDFGVLVNNTVKGVILMGMTADKIEESIKFAHNYSSDFIDITRVDDMEAAVHLAWRWSVPGDVIVLSPASASFDMFENFAQRGQIFKSIVHAL